MHWLCTGCGPIGCPPCGCWALRLWLLLPSWLLPTTCSSGLQPLHGCLAHAAGRSHTWVLSSCTHVDGHLLTRPGHLPLSSHLPYQLPKSMRGCCPLIALFHTAATYAHLTSSSHFIQQALKLQPAPRSAKQGQAKDLVRSPSRPPSRQSHSCHDFEQQGKHVASKPTAPTLSAHSHTSYSPPGSLCLS